MDSTAKKRRASRSSERSEMGKTAMPLEEVKRDHPVIFS